MEHEALRELTAGYALDALSSDEERLVDEHLRDCERCREDVAALGEAAAALAYDVDTPAPPVALRGRIVAAARAERQVVVPLPRRRVPGVVAAAVAAAAVVAAVALGLWARSLSDSLDREREAVRILAAAQRTVPLQGANGRLFVGRSGEAALVVNQLDTAPRNKTYEAWIIDRGGPVPAGIFQGDRERDVVPLTGDVAPGSTVAVTVEPEGGVDQPTTEPIFSAKV